MKKIAIIGCGRISCNHVQAMVNNSTDAELSALCDIVKENADKRAEEYSNSVGIQKTAPAVYTDYKKMIEEDQNIDIVSICTESGYHPEIAIYCMNRGKHVVVEKPMALSTKDADLMIAAAERNHVKLCVSHQNRFNPSIQKLRRAIEDGRFGKLIAGSARVYWNRNRNYYDQAPWRGTYELDGGCLMNQCIHNIDLLQWMLGGEIEWVSSAVGNYMHPYIDAEDYGSIQIKFANGAIGNVEGTVCIYPKNREETLTVIGERGFVSIGGLAVNKIEAWEFEDGLDSLKDIINECNLEIDNVYGQGHTPLYKDMLDSVINDRRPYVDGYRGKTAMEIILAAYQSARDSKRISYPTGDIASIDFKK